MATAIVNNSEKLDGSGSVTQQGVQLIVREQFRYLVEADSTTVTRADVIFNTPGLPIIGLIYGVLELKCIAIEANRKPNNPLYWDVVCTFESGRFDQRESAGDPGNPDPTTWIPVFRIDGFEIKEKILTKDQSDIPIVNSVGTKFDIPVVQKFYLPTFSFTQFESPGLNLDAIAERNDVVNETLFNSFDARTIKLNVTSAELGSFGNFNAWKITYKVTFDKDTHDLRVLDYGSEYLDAGDRQPYMDEKKLYKIYGPLDGAGGKATGDAAVLTFKIYPEMEFADFIRIA